jgi:hypothetical protein
MKCILRFYPCKKQMLDRVANHGAHLAAHDEHAQHALHNLNASFALVAQSALKTILASFNYSLSICPSLSVHAVWWDFAQALYLSFGQGYYYGYGGLPENEQFRRGTLTSPAFYRDLAIARPFYSHQQFGESFEAYPDRDCQWPTEHTLEYYGPGRVDWF